MTPYKFSDYWHQGLREVIPVIPPDAVIDREFGSQVSDLQRGKIPGKYKPGREKWVGFDGWTDIEITESMAATWDTWPKANIGLRSARYPGADFDVNSDALATSYIALAYKFWGTHMPIRGRKGSARVLIPFALADGAQTFGKHRIVFSHPSLPNGPEDPASAIEFLAAGQQYLIQGIHPSGKPYEWLGGTDPLRWLRTEDSLPITTAKRWMEWITASADWIESEGGIITFAKSSSATEAGEGKKIDDEGLRAWDREKLISALRAIPCVDLDYAEWEKVMRAAKAACGGDEAFYAEVLLDWAMGYTANTYEAIRAKWDSHTESTIGALWLYAKAREHGWEGTPEAFEPLGEEETENTKSESATSAGRKAGHMPIVHVIDGSFDPRKIPPRRFTLGSRFAPGTVTLCVAEPAAGKTTIAMCSAVAIASGRELTGETVHRKGAVLVISNEESLDELKRKLAGILELHRIPQSEIANQIVISSGEESKLIVAIKNPSGLVTLTIAIKEMVDFIREHNIVHVVIDPLVSVHEGIEENDNAALEKVMTALRRIAHDGDCSVDLLHHSNKNLAGQSGVQASARGASSITAAARYAYTLTRLKDEEIKKLGLDPQRERERLVKLACAKSNYSTREDATRIFRFQSVNLFNGPEGNEMAGDHVGVVDLAKVADTKHHQAEFSDLDEARVLQMIVEAMTGAESSVKSVVPILMKSLLLSETKVRNLIRDQLPQDQWVPVQVDDVSWELQRKRKGNYDTAPLILHRRRVATKQDEAKAA